MGMGRRERPPVRIDFYCESKGFLHGLALLWMGFVRSLDVTHLLWVALLVFRGTFCLIRLCSFVIFVL